MQVSFLTKMLSRPQYNSASDTDGIRVAPIVFSILVALVLALWPLPAELKWFRPEFGVLVIFFWMRIWFFRLGLVFAWVVGLSFDILRGDIVCQSAMGMTVVAYLVLVFHEALNRATLFTEMIMFAALMLVYELIGFWIGAIVGDFSWRTEYLYVVLVSTLCWPISKWLMSKVFAVR